MGPSSSPPVNLLDYQGLPPSSRLICETEGEDAFRIVLPPIPLHRAVAGMCVAGACLLLCTAVVVLAMVSVASDPDVDPSRDALAIVRFYVGFPVTLIALWAAALLAGRMLWQRLRTPTSITIEDDELTLITPNDLTLRRDWPAGAIERIEARVAGISFSLRKSGELCVIPIGGKCVSVLRGQDLRELEWVAKELSRRLGL